MFDWIVKKTTSPRFPFDVAATTDCGLVRAKNEDNLLCRPEAGFFCVADGMGGGACGAQASRDVCDAFARVIDAGGDLSFMTLRKALEAALQRTNTHIRLYAKEHGYRIMGSTVAFLLVDASMPSCACVCHAGDSRVYRARAGVLEPLTRDHTVGNELGRTMAEKAAARAAELQSRRNPLTHILTRAVGTEMTVRTDVRLIDVCAGDRFLLCSDGVHDMLDNPEIAACLQAAPTPTDAIERLSEKIRAAGAGDNYTMICAFV